MIDFLIYLGSGKLLLFFARKFPPIQKVCQSGELLSQLYNCDLCLGFWVYLVLAPFLNVDVKQIKNKILRWVITACFTSLLSVLVSQGWQEEFGMLVIENATREST